MAGPEWNLSDASLVALQYAEWLVVTNDAQARSVADECPDDLDQAWRSAEARDWVETIRPNRRNACNAGYTPWPRPKLTREGRLKVEEVQDLRKNRPARAGACRQAVLLWLADAGRGAAALDRLAQQDAYRFYGEPFTEAEANEAGAFLLEADLIHAIKVWGPDLIRPELTARGQQCVEFHDGNVRDFLNPPQIGGSVTYSQNFNAPVTGQVAQGETVIQRQDQGVDAAALAQAFGAMRQALSSVEDAEDREDVSDAIQDLEVATKENDTEAIQKQAGRLKRLGSRVGSTALTTATAVGTTQVLEVFGLS